MSKKAVLYSRVSPDNQGDNHSLPTQLDGMREYVKGIHAEVVKELADECSGNIPIRERPQGRQIYDLIERHQVDVVVLYTNDRTARDDLVIEYLLFKSYLFEHKVELHYSDTGLDPYTMEGNLIGYLKAHQATSERHKIIERTSRGRTQKAKEGTPVMNGLPPFGIRKVGVREHAQWVIDETNIETVKWIFNWFSTSDRKNGGLTLRAIVSRLGEINTLPPQGNRSGAQSWLPSTVREILMNEVYTGRTYYGKTRVVNKRQVKQPHDNWISIDVPHLAVIDRATFAAVQERLRENQLYARRNAKYDYLLSGFSRCGQCGSTVLGNATRQGEKYIWHAYRCGRHRDLASQTRCPACNRYYGALQAEKVVWEWIVELLTDERALDEGLKRLAEHRVDELRPFREPLEKVISLLENSKTRIDRLTAALADEADEDIIESIEKQLAQIKTQRKSLTAEQQTLDAKLTKIEVTPELKDRIRSEALKIRARSGNPTFKQKRELLRDIRLRVVFKYDGDGRRSLDASCELRPEGEHISLDNGDTRDTTVLRFTKIGKCL